jgi:hypothetical protein
MTHLPIVREAMFGTFRNWQLWLVQFVANPILFLVFAGWLLLPVSNNWYVFLNGLVAVLVVASVIALHGGTLNLLYDKSRGESVSITISSLRALRHAAAILVCAIVLLYLWKLVDAAGEYNEVVAAYFRSTLPVFLRRNISLAFLEGAFEWISFILRWIVVPGLILPDVLQAAHLGFRGFGKEGFSIWRKTVWSLPYWIVMALAALLGVLATQKIMAMTPDLRHSTIHTETASLIFRMFISYVLALLAWMMTCSVVGHFGGRLGGAHGDVAGNPAD